MTAVGEALFPDTLGQFDLGASSQLVLFVFLTALAGSAALILTRQLGISQRMLSTPTSVRSIVVGESVGRFGVALVQGLYIVVLTLIIFQVNWGDPLGALLILVMFSAVGAGAGVLMGSVFSNDQQAGRSRRRAQPRSGGTRRMHASPGAVLANHAAGRPCHPPCLGPGRVRRIGATRRQHPRHPPRVGCPGALRRGPVRPRRLAAPGGDHPTLSRAFALRSTGGVAIQSHAVGARSSTRSEQRTHNPLVAGSSPAGPTVNSRTPCFPWSGQGCRVLSYLVGKCRFSNPCAWRRRGVVGVVPCVVATRDRCADI